MPRIEFYACIKCGPLLEFGANLYTAFASDLSHDGSRVPRRLQDVPWVTRRGIRSTSDIRITRELHNRRSVIFRQFITPSFTAAVGVFTGRREFFRTRSFFQIDLAVRRYTKAC